MKIVFSLLTTTLISFSALASAYNVPALAQWPQTLSDLPSPQLNYVKQTVAKAVPAVLALSEYRLTNVEKQETGYGSALYEAKELSTAPDCESYDSYYIVLGHYKGVMTAIYTFAKYACEVD